jgi:hypothetical protein
MVQSIQSIIFVYRFSAARQIRNTSLMKNTFYRPNALITSSLNTHITDLTPPKVYLKCRAPKQDTSLVLHIDKSILR